MSRSQFGPKRLIAALAIFVAVMIGLIVVAGEHRRRLYHGRTIAEWQTAMLDTSAGVRDTAAYALTRLAPMSPAAMKTVIEAEAETLADPDSDVGEEATSALITLGRDGSDVVPVVAGVLERSPNHLAREHACQVLAALGPTAATARPAVVEALRDVDAGVRLVALSTLARLGLPTTQLGAVRQMVADTDADVRATAIETLVVLGAPPDTLLTVAVHAARDPDALVRVQAVYALAASRQSALIVDRLARALADSDPRVRGAAATLLGRLGPAARPAAAALERAASDTDREVRLIVEQSIRAVR